MSTAKWFDVDAELQKLRSTPPKAPKSPKVEGEDKGNFSHFSHFSRGEGTKTQISASPDPLSVVALSEHEPVSFQDDAREDESEAVALLTRPYISVRGELIIPFTADPRFHWWAGGQSIAQTLTELNAPAEVWRWYVGSYTETRQ